MASVNPNDWELTVRLVGGRLRPDDDLVAVGVLQGPGPNEPTDVVVQGRDSVVVVERAHEIDHRRHGVGPGLFGLVLPNVVRAAVSPGSRIRPTAGGSVEEVPPRRVFSGRPDQRVGLSPDYGGAMYRTAFGMADVDALEHRIPEALQAAIWAWYDEYASDGVCRTRASSPRASGLSVNSTQPWVTSAPSISISDRSPCRAWTASSIFADFQGDDVGLRLGRLRSEPPHPAAMPVANSELSAMMTAMGARAGEALRRGPYAWLVATLALLVLMLTPLSVLAKESDEANTALAIGATALVIYGVIAALVLAPRLIYPKIKVERSENDVAMLRWAFATSPFLVGYAAVAAGAQQWSLSAGFVSTVVLLVVAARANRRAAPDSK